MHRRIPLLAALMLLAPGFGQAAEPDYTAWKKWFRGLGFGTADHTTETRASVGFGERRAALHAAWRGEASATPVPNAKLVWVTDWSSESDARIHFRSLQREKPMAGFSAVEPVTAEPGVEAFVCVESRLGDPLTGSMSGLVDRGGKVAAVFMRGTLTVESLLTVSDKQTEAIPWVDFHGDGAPPAARRAMVEQRNAAMQRLRPMARTEGIAWLRELIAMEPEEVSPVIFIHGIGGSRLVLAGATNPQDVIGEVWPLAPMANRTVLVLERDGSAPKPLPMPAMMRTDLAIHAMEAIDDVAYREKIYGPLFDFFRRAGYAPGGGRLWTFAYDWRRDNVSHLVALDRLVNDVLKATGKKKVNLVTHSMGGLVAKGYIHTLGAKKVAKLISMVLPYHGGAFVFHGISQGYNFGNDTMRDELMKVLVQNWPAVYQIFPRYRFIFDSRDRRWLDAAEAFEVRYRGYRDVHPGILKDVYLPTDTCEWTFNPQMVRKADEYHRLFNHEHGGPLALPAGVKHYALVGHGVCTETTYVMRDALPGEPGREYRGRAVVFEPRADDGDGKVPLRSAMAVPATQKFFIRHVAGGANESAEHTEITWNSTVHDIIRKLLINEPVLDARFLAPTAAETLRVLEGVYIANRSAVTMRIVDPATQRELAPDEPGRARPTIAGGKFFSMDGAQFAWLPAGATDYRIELKGVRDGAFTLSAAFTGPGAPLAFAYPKTTVAPDATGELAFSIGRIKAFQLPMLSVTTGGRTLRLPARPVEPAVVSLALATNIPDPPETPSAAAAPMADGGAGPAVRIPGIGVAPVSAGRDPVAPPAVVTRPGSLDAAIEEFRFVDRKQDKVGPWGHGTPNGSPDGWFRLKLALRSPVRVGSIALRSLDANGQPTGNHWSSREASSYMVGVEREGRRLNASHAGDLGGFHGEVTFDLFAEDVGVFGHGRQVTVEVAFNDGGKLSRAMTIGAAPAMALPGMVRESAGGVAVPDGLPPLPPWPNAPVTGSTATPGSAGGTASAAGGVTTAPVPSDAAPGAGLGTFSVGGVTIGLNVSGAGGPPAAPANVPAEVAELLRQAAALAQQSRHAEARAIYATVLQKIPEQSDALMGTAKSLMAEKQTSAALGYLMRYLLTRPEGENKTQAETMLQQLRRGN